MPHLSLDVRQEFPPSIAQQVEQIAQMVDETSVTIRANAATAKSLEDVARKLKAQISKFEI